MSPNIRLVIDRPSNSARELARVMECRRVRPDRVEDLRRRYPRMVFVNWGSNTDSPGVINAGCQARSNKLTAFGKLKDSGVIIPEYNRDKVVASKWLAAKGIVLCRTTATGSGGEGITVARTQAELGAAPAAFYVRYVPKRAEYRVHVVDGAVIFVQEKRRRNGIEQSKDDALIRNHDNGWVFCENSVTAPEAVTTCAINAMNTLGLRLGAVDIVESKGDRNAVFLEVNTRPGLESTRLKEAYSTAIRRMAGG